MPSRVTRATLLEHRKAAAVSAQAIRAWLDEPSLGGERTTAHIDFSRPRRGLWVEMWSGLPGLMRDLGNGQWTHALLPGWQYTTEELRTEMLEDLDRFAETGEQPKEATR